ncbi:G1/S-specific cyclin-D2-like [Anopheles albimanus]|nr:G1/S-specific cyclin-D2-like [Anopheles albimanus]XP_035788126.1 G1/S-specific cyclin-D2-like [Anopheles albimanus]XP_035788127.1 G1/S-specific cyclin-D2-like [Anopheles albimanus]XP_035788128.1 G1/S-specific cyclin-D2-like [Anopheles albimanus]XP_035788129.1 G1/S-specific cyclin-D2-like [Anopheles albimanus]XP_035788130.1 G1/S-specific cyclin-D2-like [Anopheles albimanus]XP_035788131.1 G1/S-specific cyclin-D2-like [Anopheles albimanus]
MAPQAMTATATGPSSAGLPPPVVTPVSGVTASATATAATAATGTGTLMSSGTGATATLAANLPGINQLACEEIIYEELDNRFAEPDHHMIHDERIIQNLIRLERLTIPHCNYFLQVQQDIKPNMRKIVTTWMLEVCDEQKCEEQTFPLAVNFFDRFLCALRIDRYHLQLLGCCALLLASKIRQCQPLTVDVLSAYTDHAVSPDQIRSWELLLISKLEWNINAVTAFDYVDHILERAKWGSDDSRLREHAHTLIHVCNTETIFMQLEPSLLAVACIASATRGLNVSTKLAVGYDLCRLTMHDLNKIDFVVKIIEEIVAREIADKQCQQQQQQQQQAAQQHQQQLAVAAGSSCKEQYQQAPQKLSSATASSNGGGPPQQQQPETPTDVQYIYF